LLGGHDLFLEYPFCNTTRYSMLSLHRICASTPVSHVHVPPFLIPEPVSVLLLPPLLRLGYLISLFLTTPVADGQ